MPVRLHVNRASWTLLDQGLVSLGAFLVNVQLARHLPAQEFGTFALLVGGLMGLQLFNSSVLLYPMSIRLPLLHGVDRARLYAATVLLVAAACVPLCIVLSTALIVFGRGDLLLPALTMFICWQMQEAARRGLLAEFRHGDAIYGDAACYYGQVAALAALTYFGHLTLENALYSMAGAYALGAVIQSAQLRVTLRHFSDLGATAREFWSIGSWSLGNNVISILRIQIPAWVLAASGGAAAAAAYQAVLNVVNLTNPIILGLCNIIPQTAASAQPSGGNTGAWRAARIYMLIGVPPTYGYYALVGLLPWVPLTIFYGSGSHYTSLTFPTQLLALAWSLGYFADMICAYLHGVKRAQLAMIINLSGALSVLVLAPNVIHLHGLVGACLVLAGANLVRLAAATYIRKRVTAVDYAAAEQQAGCG